MSKEEVVLGSFTTSGSGVVVLSFWFMFVSTRHRRLRGRRVLACLSYWDREQSSHKQREHAADLHDRLARHFAGEMGVEELRRVEGKVDSID